MYQGFYNLTSGMLTQSRNLNVISNNMVNIQTPGYKKDKMVSTTFQEEMLYRTGRRYKDNPEPIATTSKIRSADRTYVSYEQGSFDMTEGTLDFALSSPGFFCIETPQGVRYTRNGSFQVDDEGYLSLNNVGRVLGKDGPIAITNENFAVSNQGVISVRIQPEASDEDGDDYGYDVEGGRWRYWVHCGSLTSRIMNSFTRKITACSPQARLPRSRSCLPSSGRPWRSPMWIWWRR